MLQKLLQDVLLEFVCVFLVIFLEVSFFCISLISADEKEENTRYAKKGRNYVAEHNGSVHKRAVCYGTVDGECAVCGKHIIISSFLFFLLESWRCVELKEVPSSSEELKITIFLRVDRVVVWYALGEVKNAVDPDYRINVKLPTAIQHLRYIPTVQIMGQSRDSSQEDDPFGLV